MQNSALSEKGKQGGRGGGGTFIFPSSEHMSTLTPAWNKARHHILISNFRAFISPKCHPAGLVNYWQTDTNAKGHIKEAKSSGPGRTCPVLLPSTERQTANASTASSQTEVTYDSWPIAASHGRAIPQSTNSLFRVRTLVQLQGHQGKAVSYLIKSWKLKAVGYTSLELHTRF